MEWRAAATQPATDREQREISHSALGSRPRTREQNSRPECSTHAARLGSPLWLSSAAAGNAGGRRPFSRDLLPCGQLAACRANRRTRPHGPGASSPRSSYQRYLRVSVGARRVPAAPPELRSRSPYAGEKERGSIRSFSTEGHSAGYHAADLAPVAGARRSDSGAVARRATSRDGVGGRPHARIFSWPATHRTTRS